MFEFLDAKFLLLSAFLGAIYWYLKFRIYYFWKKHNIPHESPSIPLGNIPVSYFFASIPLGTLLAKSYEKFCHYPFHGIYVFHRPVVVINDPELIRTVLVKEFHKFTDRGFLMDEQVDRMSGNLFLQPFQKWKISRAKFTPTFTPGKLKQIHHLMVEVSNVMIKICDAELEKSDVLELKDIMARYMTDIISSTVYGFNCNSLENPNCEFRRFGLRAFEFGRIVLVFSIFFPELLQLITVPFYRSEATQFFEKIFKEIVEYRRNNKVVRKDFLNLLIQLMDNGMVEDDDSSSNEPIKDDEHVSMKEASAQAFLFFLAGFETSSSTATYCLLELAKNPEVQQQLQQEIDTIVTENPAGLTYECISQMNYLDMVFKETLRKYPSLPYLNRICGEDYKIPGSGFTIPKGMRVIISALGIHHNPEYFPNPSKFDPTRFTKENLVLRNPYVHLGFGEGPRNCIGKRFGILQAKQALAALLHNYTFRICDKTKLPIKIDTENIVQTTVDGIHLSVEKRRK